MKSAQEISQQVQELGRWITPLREQVAHVVVGQKYLVDRLLLGLLANGHVLLEGVPGLAKTLTVKTIASAIQTGFQRLQFTPDLLPATQNPLEQEGTYQLPEAQLDRFMFKLNIVYPQKPEERRILDLMATSAPDLRVSAVVDPQHIIAARDVVNNIYIDDRVKDYIVDIVWATREPASYNLKLEGLVRYGASPRATIYLALAARAHAFLNGRGYVTPQDIKTIGLDVLRHRVIVSYEAEAESITSETIVDRIFAGLAVP